MQDLTGRQASKLSRKETLKGGSQRAWGSSDSLQKCGRTCIRPDASALQEGFCLNVCYMKWFRYLSKSNMPMIHPVWKKHTAPHIWLFNWQGLEITKVICLPFGMISYSTTNKQEGSLWELRSGVCKLWREKLQEIVAALSKMLESYWRAHSFVTVEFYHWKKIRENVIEIKMVLTDKSKELPFCLESWSGVLCAYN